MADRFDVTLEYVDYPRMDRGMDSEAPPRMLTPNSNGPLFRKMENLSSRDGSLGSWRSIYPLTEFETNSYPTIDQDGTYFSTAPDGLVNGQCPMWMFWDFPQSWNDSTATTQSSYGKFMGIVVTSREIHIYSPQDHAWYNATPVYPGDPILPGPPPTYGTVDVSVAGLVTISTGLHPWNTRKIVPGQLIQFAGDANWYTITSVLTGPDRLQTTFAGAAKVNVAYTIRRCFGGRNYSHGDNLLYGTVFNGDLYIAGRTLAGAGNGPAVIRVSNIYDNVYTTEYLLAGFDLTGSMSTNGSVIADLWDIKGLQILPDGRVVIATSEVPSTKTGIVGNRLRYSSNTGNTAGTVSAQEIWVASPAGFIDVIDHPGEITALGKLGPQTLTVHFHRGISLATYTAQYDPPLAIQSSGAKVGCFAPRTLTLFSGIEMFLGSDGLVHEFNGEATSPLSNETITLFHADEENAQASYWIPNAHAVVNPRTSSYHLFLCDNNFEQVESPPAAYADYESSTTVWIIPLGQGVGFYRETYPPQITACATCAIGFAAQSMRLKRPVRSGGNIGLMVIGYPSTDASGTEQAGGQFLSGMVADLFDNGSAIAPANRDFGNATYAENVTLQFETDDIDCDRPGVDKTVDHVLLWFTGTDGALAHAPPPTVEVSLNGGNSWSAGSTVSALFPPAQIDYPMKWDFLPSIACGEKFRIRLTRTFAAADSDGMGLIVNRMRVYYQTQGEIEAVNPDL